MSELRKRSAWLVFAASFLILPVIGYAQEATLNGTVTDSTGGVLPGVTITATNDETGNTFVAITDATGDFCLPVRIGVYRLTAEVFNLFDHANFGSFTTDVDSPLSGRPAYNPDVAYGSRSVQLGFRLAF